MNTATAPVWASETSKTHVRGRTGMTLMVVNIGGLAISCWMTCEIYSAKHEHTSTDRSDAFSFVDSEVSWRFPLAFQLFFVPIIYLTAFWLPESPRWLMMKHKESKALDVMVALEGASSRDNATVKRDFEEIKQSVALEQSPDKKRNTKPLFRLILGIGVQAMQQLTGINIICYYLPYVLTESVGLEGSMARLLAAVNAMTYLCSTFIGLYFIEKWGRRRLMMFGALGQCCCWLSITILLSQADKIDDFSLKLRQLAGAAVFFFFLFNCFFGAGWQGVSWLYPTEINSTQYRICGMSYGVATNWLINFGVVFVTPLGIEKLGSQFYVIWTVLNALMVPIIWTFYPETAGRSLEDIDRMFEAHPTIWAFTHFSMISRRPPIYLSGDSAGMAEPLELAEYPTTYGIECATIAQRPLSSPYQIDIRGRSSASRSRQFSEGHPGDLVENSLTKEGNGRSGDDGDGGDLAQTATVVSSQTGPSLGPQVSTTPLI